MSQIAFACLIPESELQFLRARPEDLTSDHIVQFFAAHEIPRRFEQSGYVVIVLAEYLRENGVEMPVDLGDPQYNYFGDQPPILFSNIASSQAFALHLRNVKASEPEFQAYWDAFHEASEPGAGNAMQAGLAWLQDILAEAKSAHWLMVTVV